VRLIAPSGNMRLFKKIPSFILRLMHRPWMRLAAKPKGDLDGATRFLFFHYEVALGAAVLATPLYQVLRRARPTTRITVAGSSLPRQILGVHPAVDEFIKTPHALRAFPKALFFVLRHIRPRRKEFDCVIVDAWNRRTKIALLALASGVRWRVGVTTSDISLYHFQIPYDEKVGVMQNNLRALRPFLPEPVLEEEPRVYCRAEDWNTVRDLLAGKGISEDKPLLAMITQTSGYHPNRWFDDRFARVAEECQKKNGAQIVLVGAESEVEGVEKIRSMTRAQTVSLAGETDIPKLTALFAHCDGVITLDTGGMHVARAVRVPTVVVGHSANERFEWLPDANDRLLILRHEEVPCAFCRKLECATRECMQEISVSEVTAALDRLWEKFPPSAEARARRVSEVVAAPAS